MQILMMGMNDPAGMMIAFARAINRYTEHRARVISIRTVYAMEYEHDIELPRLNEDFSEVEQLLRDSDVFHFHMLLDEDYELGPFLIRDFAKGKGLLHHHHGTYDHQCFLGKHQEYDERYRRLKRRAIVSTPDLLKLLPVATWQPNIVPLDDPDFQPSFSQHAADGPVRVVQAPTRKWHKHTAEFLRACERVGKRVSIQAEILERLTYRACLQAKRSAHMVFDHMNGWFGVSSLESLCHGVPVIAGLDDWNISHIKDFSGTADVPWVVARTEAELEQQIERLALDAQERLRIGRASRAFMEQGWTEQQVLAPLLKVYSEL